MHIRACACIATGGQYCDCSLKYTLFWIQPCVIFWFLVPHASSGNINKNKTRQKLLVSSRLCHWKLGRTCRLSRKTKTCEGKQFIVGWGAQVIVPFRPGVCLRVSLEGFPKHWLCGRWVSQKWAPKRCASPLWLQRGSSLSQIKMWYHLRKGDQELENRFQRGAHTIKGKQRQQQLLF